MFEFLLFVHILGVAAWFGANLVRAFAQGPMSKAGHATAASWHRATVSMGRVIHTPAAIAVFITGFGLVGLSEGAYEMTAPFVVVGIVVGVVGAVLAMSVLGPAGRRIPLVYEDGGRGRAEFVSCLSALIGWVDALLLGFAAVVLVLRWGA